MPSPPPDGWAPSVLCRYAATLKPAYALAQEQESGAISRSMVDLAETIKERLSHPTLAAKT